jgi:ABC-2 type transport system permease protein
MNIEEIWKKRVNDFHKKELTYFMSIILNTGFPLVIFVLIPVGIFLSNKYLEKLNNGYTIEILFSILTTLFIVSGSIRTFIRNADLHFLIPMEYSAMKTYFLKAFRYSLVSQWLILLLFFSLLFPMYIALSRGDYTTFISVSMSAFLLKYWNLKLKWKEHYLNNISTVRWSRVIIFISVLFIQLILYLSLNLVLLFLFIGVTWYIEKMIRKNSNSNLNWSSLLEREKKSQMMLYKFANNFIDIPKVQNQIKPRKMLSKITLFFHFNKKDIMAKFYLLAFFRTKVYLGMYIRQMLIGGLFLLVTPSHYLNIVIIIGVLFISCIQLKILWKDPALDNHQYILPQNFHDKISSFINVTRLLLMFEWLFLMVILAVKKTPLLEFVLLLIISTFFTYIIPILVNDKVKETSI